MLSPLTETECMLGKVAKKNKKSNDVNLVIGKY